MEFNAVKANQPKCSYLDGGPVVATPLPEGGVKMTGSEGSVVCSDVWHYYTELKIKDSSTVDKASLSYKLQAVTALGDPAPVPTRSTSWAAGSSTLPIGSIEIVEISDLVPLYYKNTYRVGFRFRFKPNSLGEVFDRASAVHNSLPPGIQKTVDDNPRDTRLTYLRTGIGSDELTRGHAILVKEGTFRPSWKITSVAFNSGSNDDDKFVYHRVE